MKKFWEAIGKAAAKVLVYCAENPQQVVAVVQAAKEVKK